MNRLNDVSVEDWDRAYNSVVNNPPHYNKGKVECSDAIESMLTPEEFVGYLRGNSLKYRWRMRYKGKAIQDLEKAEWYEKRLISFLLENKDALGS